MKNLPNIIEQLSETGNIEIVHNNETFKFNLYEELRINQAKIQSELKECATPVAFLGFQLNELEFLLKMAELERDKAWNKAYIKYKKAVSPETQRPYSDDMAKAKANVNSEYLIAYRNYLKLNKQYKDMLRALNAFDIRNQAIISINVNTRKNG